MFETSYSDILWTQVASVHHEYGRLTLATAGLLFLLSLNDEIIMQNTQIAGETTCLMLVQRLVSISS